MKSLRAVLFAALAIILATVFIQACSNPGLTRQLLSITVVPASGAAQGAPAQLQFVATGNYNTEPTTVTPLNADWGVYDSSIAAITESGLATCNATGTTTIVAWVQVAGPVCNVIGPGGVPCGAIAGTAQLICP